MNLLFVVDVICLLNFRGRNDRDSIFGTSSYYTDINCINDLSSDHIPTFLMLSNELIGKYALPKLTSKGTDWEAFTGNVERNINLHTRLKSVEELEEAAYPEKAFPE